MNGVGAGKGCAPRKVDGKKWRNNYNKINWHRPIKFPDEQIVILGGFVVFQKVEKEMECETG